MSGLALLPDGGMAVVSCYQWWMAAAILVSLAYPTSGDGGLARADDWVCPSQCPGENDTEKVQHALDHHARVYLDRSYKVTSVTIHRVGQQVEFRGHALCGVDESPDAESCLQICGRGLVLRDVRVDAGYRYRAAVRWHSRSRAEPAQYNKVFGMHIAKARIGLLYGALSSPIDAPQSENAIFGLTFRGVHVCVHANQPNGFLYIVNSVVDCNANEWSIERPGEFDNASARTLQLERGHVEVGNSEILKTATQDGHMMEVGDAGNLKLSNCHFETGAAACLLKGSVWASNVSGLVNNDSAPVLDVPADATGRFSAFVNCAFRRMMAVSRYSGMPIVRSEEGADYRVAFTNCLFSGWGPTLLSSGGVQTSATSVLFRYVDADDQAAERFVE